jgi:phospholipase/carboxylesterase
MTTSVHNDLSLRYIASTPSGAADTVELPLVIVIHGRGADANDLADLAPYLDAGYRFIFPNAPRPFEPYPGMSAGFTWFDGWPAERSSIVASRNLMLEFIDELLVRYPTPDGKLVVSGFSQGGLMSLDVGFRTERTVAGIIVMSGALYEDDLPDLRARKNKRVLLAHGTADDVIPVNAARRTRRVLEEHGIEPEYHEFPMGHQVSEEELHVVGSFLMKVLSAAE